MPMKKDSTLDFVVKKFYTQPVLQSDCPEETNCDDLAEEEFLIFCPSDQSVGRVMNFARAYNAMHTKSAGHVEMILN